MAAMTYCFHRRKFSLFSFTDRMCLNDLGLTLFDEAIEES